MKLFIMRHGQSIGNTKQGFMSGQTDPEGLTQKGKVQVIRTAYEFRKEKIDVIYASPVARAQETAKFFYYYFPSVKYITVDWLTEIHHGVFEKKYWWEIIHKISPSWRSKHGDFYIPFPGDGESVIDAGERIKKGILDTYSKFNNKKVMLVSHQGPIAAGLMLLNSNSNTKKSQEKLKELHERYRISNAEYICTDLSGGNLSNITLKINLKPLKASINTVHHYFPGKTLPTKLTKDEMEKLYLYRTLFHAWTMRTYIENPKDQALVRNSKKSKELLS